MLLFPSESVLAATFMLVFIMAFAAFLPLFSKSVFTSWVKTSGCLTRLFLLAATLPFFAVAVGMVLFMLPELFLQPDVPEGFAGAMALNLLIAALFCLRAPKYTDAGLQRLALAKGLVMYITTAEEERYAAPVPAACRGRTL